MQASTRINKDDLISPKLIDLFEEIGVKKSIHKDMYLFQEGMDANELYLVKSGLIQIHQLTSEGRELKLRICKQHDIVGELILFVDDAKYMLSGKVMEDGEVLVINKAELESKLSMDGALTFEFMKWYSNHIRKIQSKQKDLLLNGKKGALYSTLIRLTNSYGVEHRKGVLIDILLTNQMLADFCACTRESINRMLGELKKQDILSYDDSGKLIIHDIDFLRDSNGCNGCPITICNAN
jgi:CRP-like cAMP-binding protein